jgi:pimeloyl-ACP methyl ester carboxylesterase
VRRVDLAAPEGVRWIPENPTGDGVLVLAGSSGRVDEDRARVFASEGCVAESIRWFGGPGQHGSPWEIPVETFVERIDELRNECDRVWVAGTSFGSEAALLCGAYCQDVAGVIAFAPSDVVWAGYDDGHRETSHWTVCGEPLPYVPFDWNGYVKESPARFRPLYEQSRQTFGDRLGSAAIPVERIIRLLLIAGGDDQVWSSVAHADRIRLRRTANGVTTQVVTAPGAGHRTILPGETLATAGIAMLRGGSEKADRLLGERAWAAIKNLFESAR